MAGLNGATEGDGKTFLSIAGGYLWDKKKDNTDPNYGEQEWVNMDKETKVRKGARYGSIDGLVTDIRFNEQTFGEFLNLEIDVNGEPYVISSKMNTGNSQHLLKALLLMDLSEEVSISPYDFVGQDGKAAKGVSFKQNGEKLDLKKFVLPKEWQTEKDFWLPSNKKKYMRFLEDFSDWLRAEVEEKIVPQLDKISGSKPKVETKKPEQTQEDKSKVEETKEPLEPVEKEVVSVEKAITPINMKKFLKTYIEENYGEDQELPKSIKGEELVKWYNLALEIEELPFTEDEGTEENDSDSEVDPDDIAAKLAAMANS